MKKSDYRNEHGVYDAPKPLNEIKCRQNNITWPDTLLNARGVDYLLWHGSASASKVQKIGALIFGCFFVVSGATFIYFAAQSNSLLGACVGGSIFAIGCRLCIKVFIPTAVTKRR
jgi:hypothetical protein